MNNMYLYQSIFVFIIQHKHFLHRKYNILMIIITIRLCNMIFALLKRKINSYRRQTYRFMTPEAAAHPRRTAVINTTIIIIIMIIVIIL